MYDRKWKKAKLPKKIKIKKEQFKDEMNKETSSPSMIATLNRNNPLDVGVVLDSNSHLKRK